MKTDPKETEVADAKTKVGVVLGRFQLPRIHDGHLTVIREVQQRHDKVVIAIASTPTFLNRKNPLSGELRKALLEAWFDGENVEVCEVKNNPLDEIWSGNFDRALEQTIGDRHCIIYGARDNSLRHYSGKHETCALDLDLPTSATDVREKIAQHIPTEHKDLEKFAEGIIYATHKLYPISYTAVDLVVLKKENEKLKVLLCGKETDQKNKWRFCGGFVDPQDKTILDAIKREKNEELGINLEVDGYQFIGDTLVDDWRYRGTEHSIRSMLHVAWHQWGNPVPADDIERSEWFDLSELDEVIVETHKPLVLLLLQYLKTKTQ